MNSAYNMARQMEGDSNSAAWAGSSFLCLTYAAGCKIAILRTTREINDFLDKGSGKAESISPEAKKGGVGGWGGRVKRASERRGNKARNGERCGRGGGEGNTSPCAVLHIICIGLYPPRPLHANDS